MDGTDFEKDCSQRPGESSQELASPATIERPRSALHSGDFREGAGHQDGQLQLHPSSPRLGPSVQFPLQFPPLSSSPTTPWYGPPVFSSLRPPTPLPEPQTPVVTRSRAPSLGSFSSSYVLKAPTSPLVHQANNTDLDFSPKADSSIDVTESQKANRRRTLPSGAFGGLQLPRSDPLEFRALCSSATTPPRRTLTSSYSLQLASSAHSPTPRARRPSITADVPLKGHAPMVGSYEESILRGRMSMNPSKPLDFTAQIGVLGKSKCKSKTSLTCPPHVSIPFPAVFYSYPTSGCGRSISDDNPSPYVGHIDLENSLPKDESTNRRRKRHPSPMEDTSATAKDQNTLHRREKRHRRAESPKCPPGGCYKIPQQGQLQIMIKNPNKTAVKLFLVPYDLSDMEPGTKTFIRQRSYSAGPIIDMPLSARKNYGTDRPEASLSVSEDPKDKPTLRYLVHLNICCPSKGRFYLHSSIRVVFANRVPDGKERLRNEIQHPDPKYSPYKPSSNGSKPGRTGQTTGMSTVSDFTDFQAGPSSHTTPGLSLQPPNTPPPVMYNKLSKGDFGYGGYPFGSPTSPEAGESLLAKRLRELGVRKGS